MEKGVAALDRNSLSVVQALWLVNEGEGMGKSVYR